jgi:hypothetical protein
MAIGKRRDVRSFLPVCKFDATNGVMNRSDREQDSNGNWQTKTVDITEDFEAIVDMENLQIGWIAFPSGGAPDFHMVPVGTNVGEPPSDNHKEGFRVRMKLTNGAGDDVREFSSTSKAVWQSLDELHDEWDEERTRHKGKLPIVSIAEVAKVQTKSGTYYRPIFEITEWVKRPDDLTKQS